MISREQLQSIEWAIKDEDGGSWCPACASPADIGHKCDCWLARALAAPPADAGAPPALVALVREYQDSSRTRDDVRFSAACVALLDYRLPCAPASLQMRVTESPSLQMRVGSPAPAPCRKGECPNPVACHHFDCVRTAAPAPVAPPAETRGHQIVARDRDGMPWCETCRKWGVREDGPCDRTYPGTVKPAPPAGDRDATCAWDCTRPYPHDGSCSPAPPAVAGGDAPYCRECGSGLVIYVEAHADSESWYCGKCGQPFIWRRRQEGQ